MILFAKPLSDGWRRMKSALFNPFDIKKWFIVGFTAFLAGLTDCSGNTGAKSDLGDNFNAYEFFHFPEVARDWISDNPLWAVLIIIGVFFVIALTIVFTWLASRGKFMFLDNVVHDKSEVAISWNEYSREGNSLFLWRLVYGLIVFGFFLVYLITGFNIAYNIYYDNYSAGEMGLYLTGGILVLLVSFIITMYIECFLDNFVVQIMYKKRVTAINGWNKFFKVLFPNLGYFVLYGIIKFLLVLAMVIGIILVGFLTCCVGFLFLAIPYINSVVLLPFSYTFRAFSVEFLEQFGEEFKLFPDIDDTTGSTEFTI